MKAAVVILAAGQSRRMGRPKQLLPWGDTTLLGHAIRQARACPNTDTYVVVGAEKTQIVQQLKELDVSWIDNPLYTEGLGSSIRAAAVCLTDRTDQIYTHLLIMLADQPAVDTNYLQELLEHAARTGEIVATDYGQRAGVPAVFPSSHFATLRHLGGDAGAGQLLNAMDVGIQRLTPAFTVFDIDTMEDYHRHEGDS
ncbi:nucleotidyltransferase family protein [Neolewinella litorea]|uniref:Nucleotidyltransferase family protein n=1 Tax=Neolewinella litorea TaxID=2562452 RepID=A0A4S4NNV4_9BACT|nr:nucleotidyltransferase family protein [Neolewinella litorea]THH41696.1 nucleotidyltransferase family protein [Neolewinella litorea]